MADFADVVRRRRMTRAFTTDPLPDGLIERFVDLASRAPSAGKTQGWHLLVLEGDQTARFWDITLPPMRRGRFKWQALMNAPVILLPFADPRAYTERYSEPDKAATGLGGGTDAWPAPYWTIDASMSVMTLLLAAEADGLGALFFGVFKGERELRQTLGVPSSQELLGAIALGYPERSADGRGGAADTVVGDTTGEIRGAVRGRSAARPRRTPDQIIRRGRW